MKRTNYLQISLLASCLLFSVISHAQWAVGIDQSILSYASVSYKGDTKFVPEFRVGTDRFASATFAEFLVNYNLKTTDQYETYVGLGAIVNLIGGAVIPLGINVFPFQNKSFGMHAEFATIVLVNPDLFFRGSLGVRYRFNKSE